MSPTQSNGVTYLSPEDLRRRWGIGRRTLDKLNLPWISFGPKVKRVKLSDVEAFEEQNRFRAHAST